MHHRPHRSWWVLPILAIMLALFGVSDVLIGITADPGITVAITGLDARRAPGCQSGGLSPGRLHGPYPGRDARRIRAPAHGRPAVAVSRRSALGLEGSVHPSCLGGVRAGHVPRVRARARRPTGAADDLRPDLRGPLRDRPRRRSTSVSRSEDGGRLNEREQFEDGSMELPSAAHPIRTTGGRMSATTVNLSRVGTEHRTAARLALVGAGCGLAWSCALRGWMMAIAGPESTVTWAGTFGGVLAPAAVVGGLLGWAEARRRAGRPPSGWLVASPVLLGLAPLAVPGVLGQPHDHRSGLWSPGDGRAGDARRVFDVGAGRPSAPHRRRRAGLRRGARLVAGTADETRP